MVILVVRARVKSSQECPPMGLLSYGHNHNLCNSIHVAISEEEMNNREKLTSHCSF
jgi:hypothetical protein